MTWWHKFVCFHIWYAFSGDQMLLLSCNINVSKKTHNLQLILTITKDHLLLCVDSISNNRPTALQNWYQECWPEQQPCIRWKVHTFDDKRWVVTFVSNYIDDHALVLLGQMPGYKVKDIHLMSSSETKVKVNQNIPQLCIIWVCNFVRVIINKVYLNRLQSISYQSSDSLLFLFIK